MFSEELTDAGLVNLSKRLAKREDIRKLATKLSIDSYQVDTHFQNNPNDIGEAAYHILSGWRNTQDDNTIAHSNICNALQRVGLQRLINEL